MVQDRLVFVLLAASWMDAFVSSFQMQLTNRQNHDHPHYQILSSFVDSSSEFPTIRTLKKEKRHDSAFVEARLIKNVISLATEYRMLESSDHIMVCVSGGKDSAVLLHLLLKLQQRFQHSTPFQITAVHLDQGQPGYDGTPLVDWLDSLHVPYRIISEDTFSIVKAKTDPNAATYCSLCSRLRRGILYTTAQQLGCNKIALGHHGDDAVETLLLNMLHGGRLSALPPRYYASSRDLHVIRPLLLAREADIRIVAAARGFPQLPCNLCGTQPAAQRAQVKAWLGALEALSADPNNLIRSLTRVRPESLMDSHLRARCGLDPITGETSPKTQNEEEKSHHDDEEALGL